MLIRFNPCQQNWNRAETVVGDGLFILPDKDSDPDLGTKISPKMGTVTIGIQVWIDQNPSLRLCNGTM